MIEANILTYLNAQAGITSLVSSRIYAERLPQDPTYPCVTFRTDSHDLPNTFEGNTGFTRSDYLFDAWSKTHADGISLSNALRTALKNVTGSFGGINVMQIHIASGPVPIWEDNIGSDGSGVWRITQVFSIWHSEG